VITTDKPRFSQAIFFSSAVARDTVAAGARRRRENGHLPRPLLIQKGRDPIKGATSAA
jgi:hypothetical protein